MVRFIGLENSDPMLEEAIKRFVCYPNVKIIKHDLRNKFSHTMADVIISSLTIQFTPIEYRLQILKNIYDNLSNDGVFLFIEKVIGSSANINNQFINIYYGIKRENGYSEEEIQRKKFALEGVLVPVTAKWNEEMLKVTGFKEVDCFWRCLNFAGWIAYK
jgi:tRNA (cmo5U34)-methyltransferase